MSSSARCCDNVAIACSVCGEAMPGPVLLRSRSCVSHLSTAAASPLAMPGCNGLRPARVTVSAPPNGSSRCRSCSPRVHSPARSCATSASVSSAVHSQNCGRHGWPHIVTPSGWVHTPRPEACFIMPSTAIWRLDGRGDRGTRRLAERGLVTRVIGVVDHCLAAQTAAGRRRRRSDRRRPVRPASRPGRDQPSVPPEPTTATRREALQLPTDASRSRPVTLPSEPGRSDRRCGRAALHRPRRVRRHVCADRRR